MMITTLVFEQMCTHIPKIKKVRPGALIIGKRGGI